MEKTPSNHPDFDERGFKSRHRVLLNRTWWLAAAAVYFGLVFGRYLPEYYIALVGTMFGLLMLGTAGPRVAQYLAAPVSAWASRAQSFVERFTSRETEYESKPVEDDDPVPPAKPILE